MEQTSTLLSHAIALAAEKFADIYDKSGEPYILHCLYVMYKMPVDDPELRIIGVLHDLIEDTAVSISHLRLMGYSERVLTALSLLTHDRRVPYDDYIKALSHNEDARRVKLADLEHNSQVTRLKGLREKDHLRLEKYCRAFVYLSLQANN